MDSASPSPKQSDRKRPASPLAAPSPAKSSKPTPSPGKPSKKAAVGRGESWTKDDVLKLYNLINPRKLGIDWKAIEREMGDPKGSNACRKEWQRMEAKIQEAISSLGE